MPKLQNLSRDLPCTKEGCQALRATKGLCRRHYQQSRQVILAIKPCASCGELIHPQSTICKACRNRGPRLCIDCGVSLSHRPHNGARRCWSCWSKFRNPHGPICTRDGCSRKHFGKGLCQIHYLAARGKRAGAGRSFRQWVAQQPCQLCGYNLLPSEVARVIPGSKNGVYEKGNVMALCARCHREVDAGITKMPPPILVPDV